MKSLTRRSLSVRSPVSHHPLTPLPTALSLSSQSNSPALAGVIHKHPDPNTTHRQTTVAFAANSPSLSSLPTAMDCTCHSAPHHRAMLPCPARATRVNTAHAADTTGQLNGTINSQCASRCVRAHRKLSVGPTPKLLASSGAMGSSTRIANSTAAAVALARASPVGVTASCT